MGFQQGLSGLAAASKGLDAVGNNIANSGTVGFKGARAQFADVFAASLTGAGASQVGVGVMVGAVAQQFTQGNITTTNNSLDIAINGGGFYRMSNNGSISYTRNGQFQLDKSGYIVDMAGKKLQGYPSDYTVVPAVPNPTGQIIASTPADLYIDPSDLQPNATGAVQIGLNLDARMNVSTSGHTTFNTADPLSYQSSTSVTINDSLGNPHVMSMYFVKEAAAGTWSVYTAVDGVSANSPTSGAAVTVGSPTTLNFTTSGTINSPSGAISMTLDLSAVATALGKANSADPAQTFTLDLTACTQFGSPFGVNQLVQDGYSSGRLSGLSVSADGVIQGKYSNGQSRNLGQVVLAKFNNPNGLLNMGGNQWQETSASGQPLIGAPGTGSNGVLQAGAVEESNTDMTAELVNMITQQRAYQANAQTIKTQDQIMQTLVNLR